jgi:hypothetical protein
MNRTRYGLPDGAPPFAAAALVVAAALADEFDAFEDEEDELPHALSSPPMATVSAVATASLAARG